MRLLHLNNERLVLSDFRGKTIPPYAILSHRWGDSEALFEDVDNGAYKKKEDGYQKIKFCVAQAARDGLRYFWIDTCCINKWDLRERSKAITSMFRWYKDAARCYVFLRDVSAAADVPQSAWEASFLASEWFKRGWTLQELIAPASVEFFSCEGRRIGDKTSLEPLVHKATSIPVEALRNGPLGKFTIDERRGWAKNRSTTEQEDAVYCLLGILNVAMPAAYDEGVERAWRRLQAELEAAGSAPSIIPFSQSEQFVGRESQLAELETKLFIHSQVTAMAVVGPAGTGKSQLALEVAHRTRKRNKDCCVFWIDASDADRLDQSYESIAEKLRIPGWDEEKADSRQLVKAYLETGKLQCLLIFDNADDVNLGPTLLSDYQPRSGRCAVLYTTTNGNTVKALVAAPNVLQLREMVPNTAQKMLESHVQPALLATKEYEAHLLLRELSYLPLAIVQAAAYMNTQNVTAEEYQSLVSKQKEGNLKRGREAPKDTSWERDTTGPVATTLLISLDKLQGDNKLAADYLSIAACVDQKDILLDLLPRSSSREGEEAVKVLSRYGLVSRRPAESSIDLHQLVHKSLRGWLRGQGRLDEWTRTATRELNRVFPPHDHSSRSKWRRLLPHARYILSHSTGKQQGSDREGLVWNCAMVLHNDGRWQEAEGLFVQVMETRKRVLGEEHLDTLTSISNLALTYANQGRWKEAEELEVQVMETRKRVLGEEHLDTLISIGNLASTYRNQGRWKEAEELDVQVMETRKRVLREEHLDTLISIGNLASTYWNQGRWKEAEELDVQVMETRKRVLGEEHPDTLISIGNLASTYRNQGRWKEAEELEVQVMETRKRVLGNEHPDTLIGIGNLALTYRNQGRWKEAEELEVQVMETRKRVLGEEHPDTLISIGNLALTYRNQGRWKEAEELEVQVMETRKRVLGEEHPDTLISISNLASTYWNQGRWKEAEELDVRVMETRKRVLGEEHPDTLISIGNLASTYWNQGWWEEAEELEVQVMETRKRVLSDKHPDTLTSMANLASTYRNQGRWKEAEELEVQVMETRKRVLGEEHPDTLTSIGNLASTYWNQGRWKEAEELDVRVMETRKRVLSDKHPDTLTSMANLASTYRNQGRWKKAEELDVQVMETRKRVLGEEHPDTLTSMNNLAFTFMALGKVKEAFVLMQDCCRLRDEVLGSLHPNTVSSKATLAAWQLEATKISE
jgi:tetratricopeptide (TPR) repeat protein